MTDLHESLRNEMGAAQLREKEYYDLHRKPDPTYHQTIEKTGLQENLTIENLSKSGTRA